MVNVQIAGNSFPKGLGDRLPQAKMTVNLGIGYCTPPLGVSLYITGALANRDLLYMTRAVMPFILIQIVILFILTYLPDVVLWLPRLVYGYQ